MEKVGAMLANAICFVERAEFICEKVINRLQFFKEQIGIFTWCDGGFSFLLRELRGICETV